MFHSLINVDARHNCIDSALFDRVSGNRVDFVPPAVNRTVEGKRTLGLRVQIRVIANLMHANPQCTSGMLLCNQVEVNRRFEGACCVIREMCVSQKYLKIFR